jgi:hypothetical protein
VIRNITPSNETGRPFADWALNIGGSQITNFTDGISIPLYVIVLGIIGGYLRYLYKTARLGSINSPMRKIPLFLWDNVPGTDSNIVRIFLKERFDIGWISSQEFVKSQDGNTLTLTNGSSMVTITLDGNFARVALGDKEIYHFPVDRVDGKKVYQTVSWRSWVFYQSLEDLALLFLAPLLAIAVWFLLVLAGTDSKYTFALASFTIGLVTDEAIRALLRFIRRILGTVERGQRDPVTETVA